MMDMRRMSLVTARRLKAMRLKKGISHAALSRELKEKYNIDISRNSLMNYETSDQHHTKAYKNNGMKVEYLRILADYYGVSTDWLLGLSNVKSPKGKIRQTCEYTGLSQKNVEYFHAWATPGFKGGAEFLAFINPLLETPDFQDLINHIYDYYISILAENVFQILQNNYATAEREEFRRAIDGILGKPNLSPRFRDKLLECAEHYIEVMGNANSLRVTELYSYRASQALTILLQGLQKRLSKSD